MVFRIRHYARRLTSDIDPNADVKVDTLDGLLNRCTVRATEALKGAASGYSESDRSEISLIIEATQFTHESIRMLLKEKLKPTSLDALLLARAQLESLFTICLMLEDPKWVMVHVKDGWKKLYKRFLLEKEEAKDLPRMGAAHDKLMPPHIAALQQICGVTKAEKGTIEEEELGIPLSPGMVEAKIKRFPTPGGVIKEVTVHDRKQMLIRLYAEYEHLSSYVHGLPEATDTRALFGKYKDRFSTKQKEDVFQKEIAGPSLYLSFLSVVQSAGELTCLYPGDIELSAAVTEAWNLLTKYNLLGKVIWEIRAKRLLGSI